MRSVHRRLVPATLLAGAILAPFAPSAFAQHSTCRSDPIVSLAGGITIDLTSDINVDQSDVQRIEYTLHLPAGVGVTNITFTHGGLGGREWFQVVNDAPAGAYSSDTTVYTHDSHGLVNAEDALYGGQMAHTGQAAGSVGQDLSITL